MQINCNYLTVELIFPRQIFLTPNVEKLFSKKKIFSLNLENFVSVMIAQAGVEKTQVFENLLTLHNLKLNTTQLREIKDILMPFDIRI